MAKNEQLAAAS